MLSQTTRIDGFTPLWMAAFNGHKEAIEMLLKAGAEIDLRNKNGATPLYVAAQNGHKEAIEVLLKVGASVDLGNKNGSTPLYIAAQNGHKEAIELLIKAGAKVDLCNNNGFTPLYVAAEHGRKEAIEMLLKEGANLDLALHKAAQSGNKKVIEELFHAGAKIDSATIDGFTPLFIAAKNWRKEAVEMLYAEMLKISAVIKPLPNRNVISMKTQASGRMVYSTDKNAKNAWYPLRRGVAIQERGYSKYLEGALADYRSSRENGSKEDATREFVPSGWYSWEIKTEAVYVSYNESMNDRAWMEEKDKNYLERIEREGRLRELEPVICYLREQEHATNNIRDWWTQKLLLRNLPQILEHAEEQWKKILITFLEGKHSRTGVNSSLMNLPMELMLQITEFAKGSKISVRSFCQQAVVATSLGNNAITLYGNSDKSKPQQPTNVQGQSWCVIS